MAVVGSKHRADTTANLHDKVDMLVFQYQLLIDKTKKNIENQEEHHKRMTYKDGLGVFLKEYGINFNEQYLWSD